MANGSESGQQVLYGIQGALRSSYKYDIALAGSKQWQISKMAVYILESILQYDWRVRTATSLCLAFVLTYLATSVKSSMAIRSTRTQKKPPIVPYWLPFFGNLFPFLWDPPAFCSKMM